MRGVPGKIDVVGIGALRCADPVVNGKLCSAEGITAMLIEASAVTAFVYTYTFIYIYIERCE